tara:strand:+ start:39 stop:608 length:570 start_codon:yes stop_codon:yes gene_type:complete
MKDQLEQNLTIVLMVLLILFIIYMFIQKTAVCSIVRNEREEFNVGAKLKRWQKIGLATGGTLAVGATTYGAIVAKKSHNKKREKEVKNTDSLILKRREESYEKDPELSKLKLEMDNAKKCEDVLQYGVIDRRRVVATQAEIDRECYQQSYNLIEQEKLTREAIQNYNDALDWEVKLDRWSNRFGRLSSE